MMRQAGSAFNPASRACCGPRASNAGDAGGTRGAGAVRKLANIVPPHLREGDHWHAPAMRHHGAHRTGGRRATVICLLAHYTHSVHSGTHEDGRPGQYPARLVQDDAGTWWFSSNGRDQNTNTNNTGLGLGNGSGNRSRILNGNGGDTHTQPSDGSGRFVSIGVDHVMFSGDNFGSPDYERAVAAKYHGNRTAWAEASVRRLLAAGNTAFATHAFEACGLLSLSLVSYAGAVL